MRQARFSYILYTLKVDHWLNNKNDYMRLEYAVNFILSTAKIESITLIHSDSFNRNGKSKNISTSICEGKRIQPPTRKNIS